MRSRAKREGCACERREKREERRIVFVGTGNERRGGGRRRHVEEQGGRSEVYGDAATHDGQLSAERRETCATGNVGSGKSSQGEDTVP